MKTIKNRIKKKYFHLRQSILPSHHDKLQRLGIEKAKWLGGAQSPVMLMIDDFSNAWHSEKGQPIWDRGGDWGGGLNRSGSAFSLLAENLLNDFPEVRVTFFTVAGKISHYVYGLPFTYAESLTHNEETKAFFRSIHDDKRFEIAYHGYDHGRPGTSTEEFTQEWNGFRSVEEACDQIKKGKDIFREVFCTYPLGGKYGGWEYNEFADESIDRSEFLWWCRDWTPRETGQGAKSTRYEPQFFGRNCVIALPSTIHGFYWSKKQIETLLSKEQIISIEEHIAPIRPDGRIQRPNILDDFRELRRLFAYLRKKNVWHATGTEIATYFMAYSQSVICNVTPNRFSIRYSGKIEKPILTLRLDCSGMCSPNNPHIRVFLPNGACVPHSDFKYDTLGYLHLVNLPVLEGDYLVEETNVSL